MSFVQFGQHCVIGAFWKFCFLIDQCHYVQLLDGYQVQCILIVNKFNVLPIDALVIVFLLFQFENVLHEKLLQIFIRKIDAKLLETIVIEILETKNIQHTNGIASRCTRLINGCSKWKYLKLY